MEPQKTKIALYVKRSFGEKLGASFDFIKEHWKLLLKFSTYLLLPLCLVQALSLNGLTQGILAWGAAAGGASGYNEAALPLGLMSCYGLYLLLYMVGTVLLTSLVYAMVRAYQERDGCLEGMTLGVLKPLLLRNVRKLVLVILLGILLLVFAGLAMGVISKLFSSSVLLLVLCLMVLALPLALWAPGYLGRHSVNDDSDGTCCRYPAGSDDAALVYRPCHKNDIYGCREWQCCRKFGRV